MCDQIWRYVSSQSSCNICWLLCSFNSGYGCLIAIVKQQGLVNQLPSKILWLWGWRDGSSLGALHTEPEGVEFGVFRVCHQQTALTPVPCRQTLLPGCPLSRNMLTHVCVCMHSHWYICEHHLNICNMYYQIYIIYDTHMYDSHVCACTHTDTLIHIKFMYIWHT